MNYRHAFHAGNFADVLKHVVLMMLVEHLKKKPAPFFYLDTHAGGGTYDLSLGESQRSGEYKNGIGRLLEFPEAALAPELADYVRLVKACAGPGRSAITAYPGSPTIVGRMRRNIDRLVLAETHAREAQALRSSLGWQKLVSIVESDGYAALKAQLPPRENRGLVLIDPPFESDTEFDRILSALETGYERWPTGTYCIWYPLTERAAPLRFRRNLEGSGIRKVLDVTLSVMPDDAAVGLRGSGLVIVNPPWMLDERLAELLPDLHRLLVPDGAGGTSVEWWIGE
ncbi:MAG: 23S rRNA (adenine(2030)-N(6))-methyltransferase RlmJ [Steroidobacteraceae bacterium]|jgi:23S rRNA (adenine2030-N6)-methyltransferase|nr:23S rRNA (adenine(2030)-N(6))-methyltransferase RlmJ [Pseudomonadota bacterium]MBP7607885.1 23S rRNA (adenine(2030)-N(6))-methyltransferase RlmJ [Steroidobacteraceae bacterium]MBP9128719.1 23S rRNA (adenine(2030)-N(6))-methyltransferase RlmJ [Steroidobacteraceae bacterium]